MEHVVIVEDLWYKYSRAKDYALKSINLKVKKGEIVLITGPTGAGKSTLAYCLNGTIPHFITEGEMKGNVIVCGMNTREHRIPELAQKVGLVFDDPEIQVFGLTVYEAVAFGPSNLALPLNEITKRVEYALEACRLKGYEERNPNNLSGGEKQSVSIASALSMLPEVLVLDEATAMLDPIGRYRIFTIVKELKEKYGITSIVIAQEVDEIAPFADRMIVMNKGEIVLEGPPRKVLEEYETLKKIGVKIPQAAELYVRLKEKGLLRGEKLPLTVKEAAEIVKKLIETKKLSIKKKSKSIGKKEARIEEKPIIKVDNVTFEYPGGPVALKEVNLEIYPGEFIAIIGQNGSGKTTLVKHFNGLLKPTKGRVLVEGKDTREFTIAELSRTVGYVYQIPDVMLFHPTVEEELAYGPRNLGLPEEEIRRRVDWALKVLGLEEYRRELPATLPRGLRKRVAIGAILTMKPKVLVVDEPTTGQDWIESFYIMNTLAELNKEGYTIVVITHEMELAAMYAKRIIVMSAGRILLDGPPEEVFTKKDILAQASLKPPQIIDIALELRKLGVDPHILSVDEFLEEFGLK